MKWDREDELGHRFPKSNKQEVKKVVLLTEGCES